MARAVLGNGHMSATGTLDPDLWTAGGVLLGFQVSALWWRVQREVGMKSDSGAAIRISPSDYLNLAAMVVLVAGVFLYPTIANTFPRVTKVCLGVSTILFLGHAFALVGHYELFRNAPRPGSFFPRQEQVAIAGTALAVLLYLVAASR